MKLTLGRGDLRPKYRFLDTSKIEFELLSPDGETLTIAMRDGGFEIGIGSVQPPNNTRYFSFYRTCDGEIEPVAMEDCPIEGETRFPAHIGIVESESEWGKEPIPDKVGAITKEAE